ncbi:MAG TPA: arylsulfatase [Gemmataceae bacterium]|nr:arylsulfatase [Gemmataceae bacterium]
MRWSLLLLALALPATAADRPNVLVILTDDQGWGDLSLNGNTNLKTPNVDSLARDGARFDRFFVQPVCSPTRADFLTGRYHPRGGVRHVTSGGERLNLDEKTIADAFKAAGYATGCFGKWHNGSQYPYHPLGRGFDEYYGFTSGHWGHYFDPPLDHNGQPVTGKGYIADDLTNRAIDFIDRHKERPFFCYLAYNTPHSPMQVPDPYWQRFEKAELKLRHQGPKEDLGHTRAALAMCENLDDNVGRLLQGLTDRKLADNTIVVYFQDNGPNGWRWNGGMRGRKGSTDEGGVRSPLLVRWPAKIKTGTEVKPIAAAIDLLPTLSDLAGVKRVGDKPLDGVSLAPLLLGTADTTKDRTVFNHWNGRVSARTQQYRLDDQGRLYDMAADPGQTNDVARDHPDVARRLTDAVAAWRKDVLAGIAGKDDRPFPVGYPELPAAILPARDGVPHGGVRRSAGAPNCSFFTHWTATDDRMTWDVEVATPGRYEAVVYHTCPKEAVGSTIALTLNGSTWTRKTTAAHDPPLVGAAQDRVPRAGESYVKDFKPLPLGVVKLKKGRGTLTLRATDISGKGVMDVRSVVLTLQK